MHDILDIASKIVVKRSILVTVLGIAAVVVVSRAGPDAVDGPEVSGIRAASSDGHPAASAFQIETLDELAERLDQCPASATPDGALAFDPATICPHLVHLWSPGMPLSMAAISEIALAAEAMGVPLTVLPAAALNQAPPPGSGSPVDQSSQALQDALVRAGATVHYPSIVLFDGLEAKGNAVVGHKRAQGYRALLEPRLAALASGDAMPVAPLESSEGPVPASGIPGSPPTPSSTPPDPYIRVLWRQRMVPSPGNFFRRVPGTRYIAYDQRSRVILQHLETGQKLRGPGFIDFVPSPDGALFVTPSHNDGLEFYVTSRVFQAARRGTGESLEPAFRDPQMDDQYPSVGILADDPGVSTTYRILISWFEGLAVRDYRLYWGTAGAVTITPLTPKIGVCPGMGLSIPMLSKDGRKIAARDESTGTTKLFRLADDGGCEETFDFGFQTSKVSFTDDGRLIAYSSPIEGGEGSDAPSMTYVLDRETGRTTRVPFSESEGLVIPEFVGPDSLLFLAVEGPGDGTTEFRLVCCVR